MLSNFFALVSWTSAVGKVYRHCETRSLSNEMMLRKATEFGLNKINKENKSNQERLNQFDHASCRGCRLVDEDQAWQVGKGLVRFGQC